MMIVNSSQSGFGGAKIMRINMTLSMLINMFINMTLKPVY